MKHAVNFVSLGPGDPELITVKGFKLLQQADVIYCPATHAEEDKINSRAADIVKALASSRKRSTFSCCRCTGIVKRHWRAMMPCTKM